MMPVKPVFSQLAGVNLDEDDGSSQQLSVQAGSSFNNGLDNMKVSNQKKATKSPRNDVDEDEPPKVKFNHREAKSKTEYASALKGMELSSRESEFGAHKTGKFLSVNLNLKQNNLILQQSNSLGSGKQVPKKH